MWLMLSGQFMGAAEDNPEAEFGGKGHNILCFLFEQQPIDGIGRLQVEAGVTAEGAFAKMYNVGL